VAGPLARGHSCRLAGVKHGEPARRQDAAVGTITVRPQTRVRRKPTLAMQRDAALREREPLWVELAALIESPPAMDM
jgi:hypothetical protein